MKSIKKVLMAIILLLSCAILNAQTNNTKTESVKIFGNCGMCKKTIEKAGNVKNVSKVVWDVKTKMATLSYDSTKTNQDEILKRIALAGYDSEELKSNKTDYESLPKCCQYDRE